MLFNIAARALLLPTAVARSTHMAASSAPLQVDSEYPGTAVARMLASRERARSLTAVDLSGEWPDVRRRILWAAGLFDLTNVAPGAGNTGHAFNDDNHCDATCMLDEVSHNLNDGSERVAGIAVGNRLGPGIVAASDPELGRGGSWSTCSNGCHLEPPRDVAHVQFRSRIAFKLVWCPPTFASFVLVDDDGDLLARGAPIGDGPAAAYRQSNYNLVRGSKYALQAERPAAE